MIPLQFMSALNLRRFERGLLIRMENRPDEAECELAAVEESQ